MADIQEKATEPQEATEVYTPEQTEEEKPKTVTYTQQQLDTAVGKATSTLQRKQQESQRRADEAQTQLNEASQRLQDLEDQLFQVQQERDSQLFQGLDSEPAADRVKAIYSQVQKAQVELRKRERESKARDAEAMEGLKFRDATNTSKEIRKQYNVDIDPEELMACKSWDEMQSKAKDLVLQNLTEKGEEAKSEPTPKKVVPEHIDSGAQVGSGTGRTFKASEIQKMDADERFKLAAEINKAHQEGRIKWNE